MLHRVRNITDKTIYMCIEELAGLKGMIENDDIIK